MSALVVAGTSGVNVSIQPEVYQQRQKAIEDARDVLRINGPLDAQLAADALRDLSALARSVEKSRTDVKKPVLDIGRQIDKAAADFVGPIEQERARLSGLLTAYELEQRRKAAEIERQRLAEEQRKAEEERKRIEAAEAEARKAREAAEAAERAAREAKTAKERFEAQKAADEAEAKRMAAEAERQKQEAEAAARKRSEAAAIVVPEKTAGTTLQQPWTFDVIDARALYQAHPELCELTPKRSAILASIRAGAREIPGLRIYQDARVSVR